MFAGAANRTAAALCVVADRACIETVFVWASLPGSPPTSWSVTSSSSAPAPDGAPCGQGGPRKSETLMVPAATGAGRLFDLMREKSILLSP